MATTACAIRERCEQRHHQIVLLLDSKRLPQHTRTVQTWAEWSAHSWSHSGTGSYYLPLDYFETMSGYATDFVQLNRNSGGAQTIGCSFPTPRYDVTTNVFSWTGSTSGSACGASCAHMCDPGKCYQRYIACGHKIESCVCGACAQTCTAGSGGKALCMNCLPDCCGRVCKGVGKAGKDYVESGK